jgi:hypothetical protein
MAGRATRKWYQEPTYSVWVIMLPVIAFLLLILVFHVGYPQASAADSPTPATHSAMKD